MDSITIGNVEVLAFIDLIPPARDVVDFFPDVPRKSWDPYGSDHLVDGQIQLYYGCFALRSQGQVVMVDTGMGPGPHRERGNRRGDLLHQMKLQGVEPEDVNVVVHTHLHHDHVGWNLSGDGGAGVRPTFPNARYLVPRADWEYFKQPSMDYHAFDESVFPLEELGVMELIEGEHTINQELITVPTPGHTPGSVNVVISSQGEKGAVVGDMIHMKVEVENPDWCPGADVDKVQSARSRTTMLDRFESENFIVCAGHFWPGEQFGRVVRLEGRRYWQGL